MFKLSNIHKEFVIEQETNNYLTIEEDSDLFNRQIFE